jgi:hypothetical protein
MKVSDIYGSYLEAEELPEGKDIEVTIEAYRLGNANDKGKDGKPITDKAFIRLKNVKKELVLNATNAKSIRRALGENEMDDWIGKKVTIYRTTCNAFGDPKTPCIRVRGKML